MSYIGRGIDQIDNISTLDNLSFNGSDATFNLTKNGVAFTPISSSALNIQIDGIIQSNNYSVNNATVTFDFVPSASSVCNNIRHYGVGLLTTVSDNSITTAKLGTDSVTNTKVANSVITGQTAITSLADTDKFLVSDASDSGNLKYVEKQYLPSGALVSLASSDSGSDVANVVFDNVFSDTYSRYIIYIDNIFNANGGEVLRYKFRKSDGSGGYEDETRTGYTYTVRFIKHSNTEENSSVDSGGAQTYGNLTTGIQNSTGEHGLKAIINVYRPSTRQSSQATMTYVTCNGTYRAYSGDSVMAGILSSASNNYHTDAFLGIKLYFSAGNVDDHKIRVYGVIT